MKASRKILKRSMTCLVFVQQCNKIIYTFEPIKRKTIVYIFCAEIMKVSPDEKFYLLTKA